MLQNVSDDSGSVWRGLARFGVNVDYDVDYDVNVNVNVNVSVNVVASTLAAEKRWLFAAM